MLSSIGALLPSKPMLLPVRFVQWIAHIVQSNSVTGSVTYAKHSTTQAMSGTTLSGWVTVYTESRHTQHAIGHDKPVTTHKECIQ